MNILTLAKVEIPQVVYRYQPEGNGECGEILFNMSDRKAVVVRAAALDTPNNRYANKAISKIGEFVTNKNLPMEYTQAWY